MTTYVLKIDDDTDSLRELGSNSGEVEQEMRTAMAIQLFEMEKVSIGKAAQLAGIPLVRFMMRLGDLGIPVANLDDDEEIQRELSFGRG